MNRKINEKNYINELTNFFTGDKINVAFIDNGIKNDISNNIVHYKVIDNTVVDISKYENKNLKSNHGTACVKKFIDISPDSNIIDINILDESAILNEGNLIAALKWLLHQNVDIINISLGLYKFSVELYNICKQLKDKGIIINAATDDLNITTYPADFDCTMKIEYEENIEENEYLLFIDNNTVKLNCHSKIINEVNYNGTSIATALFSGYCALYIESRPLWNKNELISCLFSEDIELPQDKDWNKVFDKGNVIVNSYNPHDLLFIKEVDIKENSLISIISNQADEFLKYKNLLCKNIKDIYNIRNTETEILNFEDSPQEYNDLYIVNADHNSRYTKISGELVRPFKSDNIKYCGCYENSIDYFNKIKIDWEYDIKSIDTPVIMIAGVGTGCSKFSTQLNLTNSFKNYNLPVYNLTFNPLGPFFDMTYLNYPNHVLYPDMVYMINNHIKKIEKDCEYESIILNVPGGIYETIYNNNNFGSLYNTVISAVDIDLAILLVNTKTVPEELEREIGKLDHIGIKKIIIIVSNYSYYYRSPQEYITYKESYENNIEFKNILNTYIHNVPIILEHDLNANYLFELTVNCLS